MIRTPLRPSRILLACAPLVLAACAQGSMSMSPADIYNAAVLAGRVIGATTGSGSRTSGGSRGGGESSGANIPRSPAPTAAASRVLATARQYLGTPYTWGGNTPSSGFDCSGFTKYVFARHGIRLPRTSREQATAGRGVPLDFGDFLPGDLLLYAEPGEAISHVAIYVGSGEIIQSSSAMGGVNVLDIRRPEAGWYVQNLVAVRRVM